MFNKKKLGNTVTAHPWAVAIITVALLIPALYGCSKLQFTPDFFIYFSDDNPQLAALRTLENEFDKQENLIFIVESSHSGGLIYQRDIIRFIAELTEAAALIPHVRRVESLTNFQKLWVDGDNIHTHDLVPSDADLLDQVFLHELQTYAENQPRLLNNLVNKDGELALVVAQLSLPDEKLWASQHVVMAARKLLEQQQTDAVRVQLFGTTIVNQALEEAFNQDLSALIPASGLMVLLVVVCLTWSLAGAILSLAMGLLTIGVVFGVFGWQQGILTPIAGIIPPVLITIMVADCMHLLVSYHYYLRQNINQKNALASALKVNIKPIVVTSVTSVTTAIGMLCLNLSDSPPYRDLGNLVAMGALIACFLSLTWFPAILYLLPEPRQRLKKPHRIVRCLRTLVNGLQSRQRFWWIFYVILFLLALGGLLRLEFNEQWYSHYDDSFPIYHAINTLDDKFYGIDYIQYSLESGSLEGIYQVAYQQQVDQLMTWIEQQPRVGYVVGLSPIIKELNQRLNQDQGEFYRIPDTRTMIAQTLLLYEMSLPYGQGMDDLINIDRSASKLSVHLHRSNSRQLIEFDQQLRDWAKVNTPAITMKEGTGLDIIFAHIAERNGISLIISTGLAMFLIAILLFIISGSWKLGLISLLPNILPLAISYGIWGLYDGRIDLALSVAACMGLGLIVDDSVHFLLKYRHARSLHQSPSQAIVQVMETVGVAMVVTSLALAAGFALLILSPFTPNAVIGTLLSLIIMVALVADFTLLPLFLLKLDSSV